MTTYTQNPDKLEGKVVRSKRVAKDYVNPYLAGILLGIVLFGVFVTGNGLGASGDSIASYSLRTSSRRGISTELAI